MPDTTHQTSSPARPEKTGAGQAELLYIGLCVILAVVILLGGIFALRQISLELQDLTQPPAEGTPP